MLSKEDVARLLSDPSGGARADTAAKIAVDYDTGALGPNERKIAEEIFRLMVKDAEVRVREALAQNLKQNPEISHDIAASLARDVESVSIPVLQFSEVLSDEDLIEIVRSQDPAKQVAIAKRSSVSEGLSDALVETSNEDVVSTLVSNAGAEISDSSLEKVVGTLGESESVQKALAGRPKLPLTVSERLLNVVSQHMQSELAKLKDLPTDMVADLVMRSRERATIGLTAGSSEDELSRLINQLFDNGRLTPSIILRAACMGDMNFFDSSIARLTDLPVENVRTLAHDSGELGLRGVFDKAGLPPAFFPAVRAAVDVSAETEYDGGENDRERYSRRMIERILTQYGDLGVDMEAEDLEYLLAKMGQLPHDSLESAA